MITENKKFLRGIIPAAVILLIISLFFDKEIISAANLYLRNIFLEKIFLFFESSVNFLILAAIILLFLSGIAFKKLRPLRIISLTAVLSYALSFYSAAALKNITQRPRPTSPVYQLNLRKITAAEDRKDSFPSGHTAATFALLLPFMLYFKKSSWKKLLLSIGVLMGLSRVYLGAHFPSDVISAAIISIIISALSYQLINGRSRYNPSLKKDFLLAAGIFILTAMIMHKPCGLIHPVSGEDFSGKYFLLFPPLRLIFEPFIGPAAYLNLSSNIKSQQINWFFWIAVSSALILFKTDFLKNISLRKKAGIVFLAVISIFGAELFIFSGKLPAYKLASREKNRFIMDMHTHTNSSYEKQWSPLAMIKQHLRSGFDGSFVTDYNTVEGSQKSLDAAVKNKLDFLVLPGQEYKTKNLHLLILGADETISPDKYGVSQAIEKTHKLNGIIIVGHYWKKGYQAYSIEELINLGVDGFEIANRFAENQSDNKKTIRQIYDRCEEKGLLSVGGTDNHGLLSSTYVWNAFKVKNSSPEKVSREIMEILTGHKQEMIEVISVENKEYTGWLRKIFDPPFSLFYYFRKLNFLQWASWGIWILVIYTLSVYRKKLKSKTGEKL